jgi:hypothetical protein
MFGVDDAIGAAFGIGAAIIGADKASSARSRAFGDKRPQYKTPQSELDNAAQLETMAGYGLSGDAKSLYLKNADRGLSDSIDALLKSGGDPNQIGKLSQGYNDSISRLALLDEKAKLEKIDAVIKQRQRLSNYKDKEFQLNELYPWEDRQQAYAQDAAEGEKLQWMGINSIFGSVMGGFDSAFTGGVENTGNRKPGPGDRNTVLYKGERIPIQNPGYYGGDNPYMRI